MHTTILKVEDTAEVLKESLREELVLLKSDVFRLSKTLFISLTDLVFQFLISFSEYSPSNIRAQGLGEILLRRASRFFKLNFDEDEEEQRKVNRRRKKISSKISFIHIIMRIVLFPFYLLILLLQKILRRRRIKKPLKRHLRHERKYNEFIPFE